MTYSHINQQRNSRDGFHLFGRFRCNIGINRNYFIFKQHSNRRWWCYVYLVWGGYPNRINRKYYI